MEKIIYLILILMSTHYAGFSQETEKQIKTSLLIIDIQHFYFPGDGPGLENAEQASLNAREVLNIFRDKKQLVVHIRHKSAKGFEIHKNVEPASGEKVITKTEINSFLNTDLHDYLKENNITRLVITGMQTQMCVEAAVRAGHDYGFECIVVGDACATRDVKYMDRTAKAEDVQTAVLATFKDGRYARVIDLKTFQEDSEKYLMQKLNQP